MAIDSIGVFHVYIVKKYVNVLSVPVISSANVVKSV